MLKMASKKTVEFFYDVISPYSWIAFEALTRYQKKWNITLKLKPFLLGAVIKSSSNQPPCPNKKIYSRQDMQHMADLHGVPLCKPKDINTVVMVKGSLQAQRFLTAIQILQPDLLEEASRQMWLRVYHRDEDITLEESLYEAGRRTGLKDVIIHDALKRMKSQDVKDHLKAVTQEAIELQAFGSPFYIVNINGKVHKFFGCDRIEALAFIIGESYEGPLRELSECKLEVIH